MKLSVILTIHDRMPEISWAVANSLSLDGNASDEIIVVLDRAARKVRDAAVAYYSALSRQSSPVRFITLKGADGWRCPSTAWNAGLDAATGDVLYCFSSDTIQKDNNIRETMQILSSRCCILFGKASCSCGPNGHTVNWDGSPTGNVICSSDKPSPVGYIWAGPASLARAIGGFDSIFHDGIGYEDSDFFLRLWELGVNFEFNDAIQGLHICHDRERSHTESDEIAGRIRRNTSAFLQRYGTLDAWGKIDREIVTAKGVTTWKHRDSQ